jgi:hypothetical protein
MRLGEGALNEIEYIGRESANGVDGVSTYCSTSQSPVDLLSCLRYVSHSVHPLCEKFSCIPYVLVWVLFFRY